MKADPAVQQRLLDLADVDAELSRLAHRRRTLPEHAELTAAEAAVRTAKDKLVEAETAAGDLDRDIRRLERDVEGVRARAQRDNAMLAGAGIGAKQANDLQHELETLARRQARARGRAARGHGAARGGRRRRRALPRGARRGRAARWPPSPSAGTPSWPTSTPPRPGGQRARAEVVADLPAELLAAYETRREQRGVGAALLRQRRCQACRLELDRTALSELRAAPADEIVHCAECGVILVRTHGVRPVSGVIA